MSLHIALGRANLSEEPNNGRPIDSMTCLPAVATFLERIGAKPRSLRRAVVEEPEGRYWREIATIRIEKDGQISAPEGYAPTEIEATAIKQDVLAAKWPESIRVGCYKLPEELKNVPPEYLFPLKDRQGKLVMIQQRIDDLSSGGKRYLPWSFWSDQKWRRAEPEGLLPLWGLDNIGDNTTVFLHEGAKSARAVQQLVNPRTQEERARLAAHPWGTELQVAAHLGWVGGALNPHRTDWEELAKAGVTRAYIVADNDAAGKAAVTLISKVLRRWDIEVHAILFTDEFPVSFDLADEFPSEKFTRLSDGRRVYNGPSFNDLCRPATWMTEQVPSPAPKGRGRPPAPNYRLRKIGVRQWFVVDDPAKPVFIHREALDRHYTREAFNSAVRPFSDVNDPAALLTQHLPSHVETIAYEPGAFDLGRPKVRITVDGKSAINTYRPPRVKPVQGDPAPWIGFLAHLFPNAAERLEVQRWIATLVACPGTRMKYGVVLSSTAQGVGKTTLGDILRALVGSWNASTPSANDIKSEYNTWIAHKRLVVVNEIYEGGSWTTYNKLKSYVTDDTIRAHAKYANMYELKNWAHFLLCSNADVPLAMEDADRRWLVPEVTEVKALPGGWEAFHQWVAADGLGIILNWAREEIEQGRIKPVGAGEHAPMSARKAKMIAESRTEEEALVLELARLAGEFSEREGGRQVVFVYDDIRSWLEAQRGGALGRQYDKAFRAWVVGAGLHVPEQRFKIDGGARRVAALLPVAHDLCWPDLQQWRVKPDQLVAEGPPEEAL